MMGNSQVRNKNYISFSLWGDDQIYNVGIINNIALAKQIYIGWEIVVYVDESVPLITLNFLDAQQIKTIKSPHNLYGMFWRFLAADLEDCQYAIFRDCDSRLSEREYLAVCEWINSGKALHIMKDHPYHHSLHNNQQFHILGGMWGIKGGLLPFEKMITAYSLKNETGYGSDQFFLNEVYHILREDICKHDSLAKQYQYPAKRNGNRFIGEKINEFEEPANEDWKILSEHFKFKPLKAFHATVKNILKKIVLRK